MAHLRCLPAGWTAETETVDRIRLCRPPGDDEKAAAYLEAEGYDEGRRYTVDANPANPEFTVDTSERPSRSVPLDELMDWFDYADPGSPTYLSEWRSVAAEKWGAGRAEEADAPRPEWKTTDTRA